MPTTKLESLNPYSTGIWSATQSHLGQAHLLMGVLILILLEYGLQQPIFAQMLMQVGLNPYSTGIWSATSLSKLSQIGLFIVLILILLEYGLQHLPTGQGRVISVRS